MHVYVKVKLEVTDDYYLHQGVCLFVIKITWIWTHHSEVWAVCQYSDCKNQVIVPSQKKIPKGNVGNPIYEILKINTNRIWFRFVHDYLGWRGMSSILPSFVRIGSGVRIWQSKIGKAPLFGTGLRSPSAFLLVHKSNTIPQHFPYVSTGIDTISSLYYFEQLHEIRHILSSLCCSYRKKSCFLMHVRKDKSNELWLTGIRRCRRHRSAPLCQSRL